MMKPAETTPPDLEPRFLPPDGWRWHVFRNSRGQKLRFGTVTPKNRIPDAVVVGLPGLSEFAEKYFELAHDLLKHNLGFWFLDWQGQGLSERPLPNPHKRHSTGFENDIDDLHFFIMEYVKHASVHPDVGRIPMVMLAHSMGANIGLRYLLKHPDIFSCAAFSAPMTGIVAASGIPGPLRLPLAGLLKTMSGTGYVFGGHDWQASDRAWTPDNIFSSDPVRAALHNQWCESSPGLQVGSPTFGWLYHALKSCARLSADMRRTPVSIPSLFALAGDDKIVDNAATRRLISRIPSAKILDIPGARHEIIMENDALRSLFIEAFINMLQNHNIRDQLKPF